MSDLEKHIEQQYREEVREWRAACNKAERRAEKLAEALDTIMKLADPENDVGDRMTLTSCYEVARDALKE